MAVKLMERFAVNPKKMFLIDSLGAMLTVFFLFFVLKRFNEYIGMPVNTLNYLSAIAFVFFLYSFSCFNLLKKNWKIFLGIIITANILYMLLTLSLIIYNAKTLTILGTTYFILEIFVVIGLVSVEIRTLRTYTNFENDARVKTF